MRWAEQWIQTIAEKKLPFAAFLLIQSNFLHLFRSRICFFLLGRVLESFDLPQLEAVEAKANQSKSNLKSDFNNLIRFTIIHFR